jgi:hypothetical protein
MSAMRRMCVVMIVALAPACDTDDFVLASDGCPSSTGAHEDTEGEDCVTGECEEEGVSVDAVAGIHAGPASPAGPTRPGRPLTLAQERP